MNPPELRLSLPVLECGALLRLRPWRASDAVALAAAWSDPEITAGSEPPPDRSVEGATRWIEGAAERCRAGLAVDLVIADLTDDRVLGEVGLSSIDPRRGAALIGWWVADGERGRGVASAAVDGFATWAIDEAGFVALVAEIEPANEASLRVAERCRFEMLRAATDDQTAILARRA